MSEAPKRVSVAAPAKVNLFLRVLERRPDGFHDIETVFQAIDLTDRVEVGLTEAGIDLAVEGPDLGPTEENLAYRAAQAMVEAVDLDAGVDIRLVKRIPAGAGLGGGSSDAAAVLRALDALLGGPLAPDALMEMGATIGSDVPFFLCASPLAMARGRGERLQALPPLPPTPIVLVLPPVHVATSEAYAALAEERVKSGVPPAERRRLDAAPHTWTDVARCAWNDFEHVVAGSEPLVAASLDALREVGSGPCLLSGSGAACFGIFEREDEAEAAAASLRERLGSDALVVRTLDSFAPPAAPGG